MTSLTHAPALPGMDSTNPLAVFCPIDDLTRDGAVADAVIAGRFTHAGITCQLGTEPDWRNGPFPADDEWRIEWSKFYYGLDLAHAHSVTGDRSYLDTWEQLVGSWIAHVPVDHDSTDVVARRVQNWTYAWIRFAASPTFDGLTAGLVDVIRDSIAAQLSYLRSNLSSERNHRTLELYALLVCALAHPSIDLDGELCNFALFELYRNLCSDVLPDGVHRERSTHYHAVAMRSFLGLRLNADLHALELPQDFDRRLQAGFDFLSAVMRPDGSLPMLSDSDDGDHRGLLLRAADRYDREDFRYVATSGQRGRVPGPKVHHFDQGGYQIIRGGWGDRDRSYKDQLHVVFDCGPVGDSGHGHYDALHVEVSSHGRALLVDPGRYTYAEDGGDRTDDVNWRHWFKGTAAHNTVCVDGLDQTPYHRGKHKGSTARAQLVDLVDGADVVMLTGEVHSPAYDVLHRRRVIVVSGQWLVVEDVLLAHSPHDYALRWHFTPDATGKTVHETASGLARVALPGLDLHVYGGDITSRIEPGWVAPLYGHRVPAPVLAVGERRATSRFISVIVPRGDGDAPALITKLVDDDHRTVFSVHQDGVEDTVGWSDQTVVMERQS